MSDTPSLVLAGSPNRWMWSTLGCGLIAVFGAMVGLSGHYAVIGWVVAAVFAWLAITALRQMRRADLLIINEDTFDLVFAGTTTTRDFASCSEFGVWREGSSRLVVFDHPTDDASPNAEANRKITGRTGSLPDRFGLRVEDLAQLLNTARARALGAGEPEDDDDDNVGELPEDGEH